MRSNQEILEGVRRPSPSSGTPGEGRGGGASHPQPSHPHPNPSPKYRERGPFSRRRGLGLPELLISLAIAASLLTATGFALHGSSNSYQINQEQSSLLQANRLTLNRITTMIRTTKLHQPHSAAAINSFAAGTTVSDTGIDMFDAWLATAAKLLDDPAANPPRADRLARAATFTWSRHARTIADAYGRLLNG